MDAIVLLRSAYLGAAALVLAVFALPPLRTRFLDYGARSSSSSSVPPPPTSTVEQKTNSIPHTVRGNVVSVLLDKVAAICVPHSWFTSFYAVSVACSLYWATDLLLQGPGFNVIAASVTIHASSMTVGQIQVTWVMMFAQGGRRLYECVALSKPSQSQMWFGHWVMGILFYVMTGIAVWVEGVPAIKNYTYNEQDLVFVGPSIRTSIGFLLHILASGLQYDCHDYLAALKDSKRDEKKAQKSQYRMPEHPAWNLCLTPHYFAECLIYLSMAITAAPEGHLLNGTFVCALIFVVVNLGVTADGSKKWYQKAFGAHAVKGRSRMVPLLY